MWTILSVYYNYSWSLFTSTFSRLHKLHFTIWLVLQAGPCWVDEYFVTKWPGVLLASTRPSLSAQHLERWRKRRWSGPTMSTQCCRRTNLVLVCWTSHFSPVLFTVFTSSLSLSVRQPGATSHHQPPTPSNNNTVVLIVQLYQTNHLIPWHLLNLVGTDLLWFCHFLWM